MHIALQQVLEMHQKMRRHIGDPRDPDVGVDQQFRLDLIEEEFDELYQALNNGEGDMVAVADALADMLYAIIGSAVAWGIDIASVFDAVHDSNMTKTDSATDKKLVKGPDYKPPKIAEVLIDAANCCNPAEEDSWWPVPTKIIQPFRNALERDYHEELQEISQEVPPEFSDKIMYSAREQAKILAMQDLKKHEGNFVEAQRDNAEANVSPAFRGSASELEAFLDEAPTLTYSEPGNKITGHMTSYGAFIFDCQCGRTHAVQATLGSRGGMAPDATSECMCGRAFKIEFPKNSSPLVHMTTIEALRPSLGKDSI